MVGSSKEKHVIREIYSVDRFFRYVKVCDHMKLFYEIWSMNK